MCLTRARILNELSRSSWRTNSIAARSSWSMSLNHSSVVWCWTMNSISSWWGGSLSGRWVGEEVLEAEVRGVVEVLAPGLAAVVWHRVTRIDLSRRLGLLDRGQQRLARDQARAAAVGQERPRPADDHDEPVGEADQVRDVDPEPEQPGDEAALPAERPEPRDVGDPGEPADDRDLALVRVPERRRRLAGEAPTDRLAGIRAALDAALGDARDRPTLPPRHHGGVADDEDLGVAGDGQVGPDDDPSRPIGLGAGRLGRRLDEARHLDAGRPEHGPGRKALLRVAHREPDRPVVDVDDLRSGSDRDAQPFELALGRLRAIRRIRRQDPVHRLDEDDPGVGRVDRAEVALQRVPGDLAERARQLGAGRAGADDDERHPFRAADRVGLALGGLERDEDPPPDLGGVLDRLEARRVLRPLVVAEVREAGAGRDDQRVVGDRAAVGQPRPRAWPGSSPTASPSRTVVFCRFRRIERSGWAMSPGLTRAGRDLVEERLEQMEVAAIDERDLDALVPAQPAGRVQPAEAAADDQDAMPGVVTADGFASTSKRYADSRIYAGRSTPAASSPPPATWARSSGKRRVTTTAPPMQRIPPDTTDAWAPTSAATAAASMSPIRGPLVTVQDVDRR